MATFKAIVRTKRKDGFYQVYIRCVHNKKPGYIKTDKVVTDKDLDKNGEIRDPFVKEHCSSRIVGFIQRLNRKDIRTWTVRQVIDFLSMEDEEVCFSDFARLHISRMRNRGHQRNARNYELALQHMERFAGTKRIMCGQLTSTWVNLWIKGLEMTARAKEMYPVCMRQVFREAVKEYNDYDNGVVRIRTNPWPRVKIPQSDRARKRAISAEECRRFFAVALPESLSSRPKGELGRDVAMMVLCLAGINTIDLYNLKKTDYHRGVIAYKRAKTMRSRADEAFIEMRVEPILLPLFEKYRTDDDDPYLFSFHRRYADSDSFGANANAGVKDVCRLAGVPEDGLYCIYTFRHTWGTIAQNDCGASIAEVGFAMNHSGGHRVTRGYIKPDFSPAWELNAKVIEFIFFSNAPSKLGASRDLNLPCEEDRLFRLSPKKLVYARAYFRGELLGELTDIGFSNVDEVISVLAGKLPDTIPTGCTVHFRIRDVDANIEVVYERTKGKGF